MAMKIGEVAKRSSIGIETIRYYEREGLLLEPERRPSGYRQYDESTVERLEYIRRAKELGFTLAEIKELLELSFVVHAGCNHIRQRAEAKVADIEVKIRSLQQMKHRSARSWRSVGLRTRPMTARWSTRRRSDLRDKWRLT